MYFETVKPLAVREDSSTCEALNFTGATFHLSKGKAFGKPLLRSKRSSGRSRRLASLSAAGETQRMNQSKNEVVMTISAAAKSAPAPAEEPKTKAPPAWRFLVGNLAAGALAGCTVEAVLYPIDTIKTRLQAMTSGGGISALFKGEGMGKLYSGLFGNLVGVAPASGLFFMAYEPSKKAAKKYVPEDAAPFIAGAMAGVVASFVRVPTEVVKQRMQTREFAGAGAAVRHIASKEGVRGLYAGYGAFMLRDLPFDAVEFFTYEALKSIYKKRVDRDLKAIESAGIGAFAGGFTGLVTTPFDVLKTRLMTQGTSGRYTSIFDATAKIWAEEGPGAFLKGWQPRLVWISLGGCVFFTALEQFRNKFVPQEEVKKN